MHCSFSVLYINLLNCILFGIYSISIKIFTALSGTPRSPITTVAGLNKIMNAPVNIIFLTCDAYGVLPPVARLTKEQAMYHYLSGYTAKVAGTELGVTEPKATFSACFGQAFLLVHPIKYAQILAQKITTKSSVLKSVFNDYKKDMKKNPLLSLTIL